MRLLGPAADGRPPTCGEDANDFPPSEGRPLGALPPPRRAIWGLRPNIAQLKVGESRKAVLRRFLGGYGVVAWCRSVIRICCWGLGGVSREVGRRAGSAKSRSELGRSLRFD